MTEVQGWDSSLQVQGSQTVEDVGNRDYRYISETEKDQSGPSSKLSSPESCPWEGCHRLLMIPPFVVPLEVGKG